jgi:hypothetical protein
VASFASRMAVVRLDVDRALEEERFVETSSLSRIDLAARSAFAISSRTAAFLAFQICSTDSLSSRMYPGVGCSRASSSVNSPSSLAFVTLTARQPGRQW